MKPPMRPAMNAPVTEGTTMPQLRHNKPGTSVLAAAVQQSNGPTPNEGAQLAATDVAPSDRTKATALHVSAPVKDVSIKRFYTELMRSLPEGYAFDEESRLILDIRGSFESEPITVCGPIRVVSWPRRLDGSGWSIEVEFLDREERLHQASFPHQDIITGKGRFFATLIDRGLDVHAAPGEIAAFLKAWEDVDPSWRTDHAGWFVSPDGTEGFVRPDGATHVNSHCDIPQIVLFDPQRNGLSSCGSLAGWQTNVAALALGNPTMIFAIAVALAGPLLRLTGIDTVGFNFFGTSGVGKSLLLRLAASCGADPQTVAPWTVVRTGLHRLSPQTQDGLLVLDGFPSNPDSRMLKALLAIADDAGFGRIVEDRDPDGAQRWRRMLLSGSERPLSTILQHNKQDVPAAFHARIVDISAANGTHGLIDALHGYSDATIFARHFNAALHRHYGHLLPAFLDALLSDLTAITTDLHWVLPERTHDFETACLANSNIIAAALPQIAERFALVEYAGELAIRLGLLPWPPGTAQVAVQTIAARVRASAAPGGMDAIRARSILRRFLESNAEHIVDLEQIGLAEPQSDAKGWRDNDNIYLRSETLRKEIAELDELLNYTIDSKILKPGGEARSLQYKMPKTKVYDRPRVYRFDRKKLEDDQFRQSLM